MTTLEQPSIDTNSEIETRTNGCVKWFNNKSGYGFINVVDGDNVGTDVFVHHSAVCVGTEQYRYLIQGEYVTFIMKHADTESHEWQAGDVKGVNGGKLMCETRHDVRSRSNTENTENTPRQLHTKQHMQSSDENRNTRQPRYRGTGPREGEVWEVVRKRVPRA